MELLRLLTAPTSATRFLVTSAPTMGDTTSSAIVSRLDSSAAAIPLADSMQVDFMAVAAIDKLEGSYQLGFAICYSKRLSCDLSWLAQWKLSRKQFRCYASRREDLFAAKLSCKGYDGLKLLRRSKIFIAKGQENSVQLRRSGIQFDLPARRSVIEHRVP